MQAIMALGIAALLQAGGGQDVEWLSDYDKALEASAKTGKPIFVYLWDS